MTPRPNAGIKNLSDIERVLAGPVMIDTCILFSGITRRHETGLSFTDIKRSFMDEVFSKMQNVLIHETVLKELENSELHAYISERLDINVHLVGENELYSKDPKYTMIFSDIAKHYTFGFDRSHNDLMRCPSKNRGEIASMAYAAYHGIPFFATSDQGCYIVREDLPDLKKLMIFGAEVLLYIGYCRPDLDSEARKSIKALYKYLCAAGIKQGKLPKTFNEFRDLILR